MPGWGQGLKWTLFLQSVAGNFDVNSLILLDFELVEQTLLMSPKDAELQTV